MLISKNELGIAFRTAPDVAFERFRKIVNSALYIWEPGKDMKIEVFVPDYVTPDHIKEISISCTVHAWRMERKEENGKVVSLIFS